MKKSLLIIALIVFILTSATTIAGNSEKNVSPIGNINFTDRVVYILDHTSDPTEGNWITLGYPYEERRIQLPHPIKLTYSGPKFKEYEGASGTLYKDENESYTITYPSSSFYLTHPVYLPGEKVNMSFHGDSSLKGTVGIYLFNITSDSAYGVFDAFKTGEVENLDNLFNSNMEGNYKKYTAVLGENGDLLNYDFGPLDSGQYCILMIQENEDNSLTALSATAFVVEEYKLHVSAPASIVKGEDLDINMALESAPNENNCTYGAVLIRETAYKANIEIGSHGTKNSTSVTVNDVDLIDEFDTNSSNSLSKLTIDELQTKIQTIIGEGKGSIAIGEKGQKTLSLTAFDLSPGSYYLLAGAYSPGKGLVGLTQLEVKIKSNGSSDDDAGGDNGARDSGSNDNGARDSGSNDNGARDSGSNDNGARDSGSNDNGANDSESGDNESNDSGSNDNGANDSESGDNESNDSGSGDNGANDNGANDNGSGGDDNSGSGGNGGNGGGVGGSPEPAKNVKSKELCQQFISNGKQICFKFIKEATSVDYVKFNSKKTAGKITTIVEDLKGRSSLTLSEPADEIYKYINIWIGNGGFPNSKNIEDAIVGFRVSKEWITENNINTDTIVLQHFNENDWNSLPTKKLSENEEYIYFESEIPSFSPFAITAEKNVMAIEEKTGENQSPSEIMINDEIGAKTKSGAATQENKKVGTQKITNIFVGFIIVLLMSAIIFKKMKKMGPGKKDSEQ
ncbi:MAG: TIGR04279 domain-containing protein [Methanosarcina barkeri]|nr:TIGR04279 domain-containing protein [Methanosarcina sp. ERenArc_MAG2]